VSPYVVVSPPCSPRRFEDAAFVAISQQGYFSANAGRLPANSPNIPAVYARIGPVTAPVLIDTGFEEDPAARRGIVMVNSALFAQLRAAGVAMQAFGTEPVFDCNRRRSDQPLWQVSEAPLVFATREGEPFAQYGAPMLLVKAAGTCTDIASVSSALGLVGVIYVARWGVTIFDGPNERLWVKRNPTPARPASLYRALAIAWDKAGSWQVEGGETTGAANRGALAACNAKHCLCRASAKFAPSLPVYFRPSDPSSRYARAAPRRQPEF
jgi:hypothetical protein